MRWFWIFLLISVPCYAVTQIYQNYDNPINTYIEFQNFSDNAQDKGFTEVTSTPNYQDLREGEMVIYVSTPPAQDIKLMLRVGTTVYASPVFPIMKGR